MTKDINIIVPTYSKNDYKMFCERNSIELLKISVFVTREFIKEIKYEQIIQKEEGIYGAINSGLKYINSEYYCVAGCDDIVNLTSLKNAINNSNQNIITGPVLNEKSNKLMKPNGKVFYHLHQGLISEHSIGTIFKTDLHLKFGYYSLKYKIAADADFILKLYKNNIVPIYNDMYVFGSYSGTGVSSKKFIQGQKELKEISKSYNFLFFYYLGYSIRILINKIRGLC